MDRTPAKLTLFLGLFSGVSISSAWLLTRPQEIIGSICIGTAVCALMLIVLRFDKAIASKNRRRTDGVAGEA